MQVVAVANGITGAVARIPDAFWALALAVNALEITEITNDEDGAARMPRPT